MKEYQHNGTYPTGFYTYVLELDQGKYYVGYAEKLSSRLHKHFAGRGSVWTKKYKPKRVLYLIPTNRVGHKTAVNIVTIYFMDKFGWKNVRGGSYSTPRLVNPPLKLTDWNRPTSIDSFSQFMNFGYYPKYQNEPDNLYLLKFTGKVLNGTPEVFLKIGRSFDMERRIGQLLESGYDVELLASNKATHKEVYKTEQKYHKLCSNHHYLPQIRFGGSVKECFTLGVLDLITINP